MTRNQKEYQRKLQIERQVLSVQLQNVHEREVAGFASAVDLQMHGRLDVRLGSIERAMLRLDKGTFGTCQSCGEEIDRDRLEALPYAEQCINCQRKLERRVIRRPVYAYPSH